MVLIRRWHVRVQVWWLGENGVVSYKIVMIVIAIVIIIIIVDNTSAILKFASPLRHDGALGKGRHSDGRKGCLRDWRRCSCRYIICIPFLFEPVPCHALKRDCMVAIFPLFVAW